VSRKPVTWRRELTRRKNFIIKPDRDSDDNERGIWIDLESLWAVANLYHIKIHWAESKVAFCTCVIRCVCPQLSSRVLMYCTLSWWSTAFSSVRDVSRGNNLHYVAERSRNKDAPVLIFFDSVLLICNMVQTDNWLQTFLWYLLLHGEMILLSWKWSQRLPPNYGTCTSKTGTSPSFELPINACYITEFHNPGEHRILLPRISQNWRPCQLISGWHWSGISQTVL